VDEVDTVLLTWSGATSTDIDVYRRNNLQMSGCDLELIATTPNDGSYTDSTGDTGRAGYKYRVCEAGTTICSDIARVRFQH
jgi:thermitase